VQLIEDNADRHDDSFGTRLRKQWEVRKDVVASD
jgi:hypothetical protein